MDLVSVEASSNTSRLVIVLVVIRLGPRRFIVLLDDFVAVFDRKMTGDNLPKVGVDGLNSITFGGSV